MGLTKFQKVAVSLFVFVFAIAISALVMVSLHWVWDEDLTEDEDVEDRVGGGAEGDEVSFTSFTAEQIAIIQDMINDATGGGGSVEICDLFTGLPEATNPDQYLLPAVEGGNCVRKTTPHFPSLLQTCRYVGSESQYSLITHADQGWVGTELVHWVITEITVQGVSYTPPTPTSPSYVMNATTTLGGDLRMVMLEFINHWNSNLVALGLDSDPKILMSFASSEGSGYYAYTFGAQIKITTRAGITFQLTYELWVNGSAFQTYSYTDFGQAFAALSNPPVFDNGFMDYMGGCFTTDMNIDSVSPNRAVEIPCGKRIENPTKGRASTPLGSNQPLTDWNDANPLLKERVDQVKASIVEEYKLDDPAELQMWLFGSQMKGRSRSGTPDIDLEVYHPSLSNMDPRKQKVLDRLPFAVDVYFRQAPPKETTNLRIQ